MGILFFTSFSLFVYFTNALACYNWCRNDIKQKHRQTILLNQKLYERSEIGITHLLAKPILDPDIELPIANKYHCDPNTKFDVIKILESIPSF